MYSGAHYCCQLWDVVDVGLCGVQCGVWCAGSVFSLYSVQCVVCTVQCGVWSVFIISYLYSWSWCGLACPRPSPPAASPPLLPSILGLWAGDQDTAGPRRVHNSIYISDIISDITMPMVGWVLGSEQ